MRPSTDPPEDRPRATQAPHDDPASWGAWARRWEARMAAFFPGRSESVALTLDLVAELASSSPGLILDLGSGPGSLAACLLTRFPTARVVALDFDPVLLRVGRGALGDAGGRLTWVRANLRELDWPAALAGVGPFDAVLSLATLHHLPAPAVRDLYRALADLLRPGGLFVNVEGMAAAGRGARLTQALRDARVGVGSAADSWWEDVAADPTLAPLAAEREALLVRCPTVNRYASAERHCRDLRAAGFAEAALAWRRHDETMVAALR